MFEGWLFGVVFPWSEDRQHLVSVRKVDNGLWAVFVLWFGCFETCGKKRLLDHILKDCYIMFPDFSVGLIWLSCNKSQKGSSSDRKKIFLDNKEANDSLVFLSLLWPLIVCWSWSRQQVDRQWRNPSSHNHSERMGRCHRLHCSPVIPQIKTTVISCSSRKS